MPCKREGLAIAQLLEELRAGTGGDEHIDAVADLVGTVSDEARCYLATQHEKVIGSLLPLVKPEGERSCIVIAPIVDIVGERP